MLMSRMTQLRFYCDPWFYAPTLGHGYNMYFILIAILFSMGLI